MISQPGFISGLWLYAHCINTGVAIRYSCPRAACCNPTALLVEKFMWLLAICFSTKSAGLALWALIASYRQMLHHLFLRAVPKLLVSGLWPACSYASDLPLRHGQIIPKLCNSDANKDINQLVFRNLSEKQNSSSRLPGWNGTVSCNSKKISGPAFFIFFFKGHTDTRTGEYCIKKSKQLLLQHQLPDHLILKRCCLTDHCISTL